MNEERVLEKLRARFELAKSGMAVLHGKWMEDDRKFLAIREEPPNKRTPYRELSLPYGYAMLMAAHTYLSTVFLGRSPVVQLLGRTGEDEEPALIMENLIDYQLRVGGSLPVISQWLLDILRYGVGVLWVGWTRDVRKVRRRLKTEVFGIEEEVERLEVVFEGNRLRNVRPYDFYPDPRVPLAALQEGEFCGLAQAVSVLELMRLEEDGVVRNVEKLRKLGRVKVVSDEAMLVPPERKPAREVEEIHDVVEMVVDLVPRDWGLGRGKFPEKWVFWADGGFRVLLKAERLEEEHGRFPFVVQQFEPDVYTRTCRGLLDVLGEIQATMDWLLATYMDNVRQVLNGTIVADGSRIVLKDLEKPPAVGRIVKATAAAAGSDLRTAVFPLNVPNVTGTHLQALDLLHEFGQRALGINDQILGMLGAGGTRKTATEIRASTTFGTNRLRVLAEAISMGGFATMVNMMVQNTQQFMTQEMQVRVAGKAVTVRPEDIGGIFDFVPVDGTLPVDRLAQARLWQELLGMMAQVPEIAQKYDLGKVFGWIAQLAGVRNLEQFRRDTGAFQGVSQELLFGGSGGVLGAKVGAPEGGVSGAGSGSALADLGIARAVPGASGVEGRAFEIEE